MSLLDSLTSLVSGDGKTTSAATLIPALIEQLSKYPGGLSAFLQQLQQGGLSAVVASWLGAGPNQAVSPAQLDAALEPRMVDDLAQRTGQNREGVLEGLSALLPKLVDQASPTGSLDEGHASDPSQLLNSLSSLLGGGQGSAR